MGGWIKLEKDLLTDPRVIRMGAKIGNGGPFHGVTVVLGGLAHLWMLADTHIGNDDVIPLGTDEINQVIGINGFCQLLPQDWLQVIDSDHVKLPGFHTHNGTIAKERAQTAKRVQRHRTNTNARQLQARNGHALPDLDLDLDQDRYLDQDREKHTEARTKAPKSKEVPRGTEAEDLIRLSILAIKAKFPKAAREDWISAEKAIRNLIRDGTSWDALEGGVERYAKYCCATNRLVQNPANWFGAADRPWLQAWEVPKNKADNRLASNVDVMQQFVGGT